LQKGKQDWTDKGDHGFVGQVGFAGSAVLAGRSRNACR
jgi:hypothetical protein